MLELPLLRGVDDVTQIFHEAYIPRRLNEVEDHEGDFDRLGNADTDERLEGIYYQTIAGARRLCVNSEPC